MSLVFSYQNITLNLFPYLTLSITNDIYSHQNSAACYELAQSVLKIGFALAERVGREEVGGCHPEGDSAWWLLHLAVRKAWSAMDGLTLWVTVHGAHDDGGCCSWP